jgi:tetratricopeptide (TPR) repeat protein
VAHCAGKSPKHALQKNLAESVSRGFEAIGLFRAGRRWSRFAGMDLRFRLLCLGASIAAVALAAVPPAASEAIRPPGGPPAVEPIQPPNDLPRPSRGDTTRNLDFLFEALKAAPDEASAKAVEDRIWALWLASGSDTANLLMTRVKSAIAAQDLDLALKLLDAIVALKPDYIEAWNRRATLYYMKKDFDRALADIQQVLAREPRHFGAMSGLGMILQEVGDEKQALDVFRRALAVHPRLPRIPDLVKSLSEKVEGRDI